MPPPGTEEYIEKRERNNVAVRKSREKTRTKAKQTVDKVTTLCEENRMLEQQVEILSKELTILKDLFKMMHGDEANSENTEISVQTDGSTSPVAGILGLNDSRDSVTPITITPMNLEDHDYLKLEP